MTTNLWHLLLRVKKELIGMQGIMQSRRDFLKTAGAVAASAGVLSAAAASEANASESESAQFDEETDILVLGGGVGGTIAAYVASTGGAATILVEAGAELGGSMLISTGWLHTSSMDSADDVETMAPSSDYELAKDFLTKWVDFRDSWLIGTGAPNVLPIQNGDWNLLSIGSDYASRKEFFDFFQGKIEDGGGSVRLNTRGEELIADEENAVIGAIVVDDAGKRTRIGAKKIILATGGFGANSSMAQAHLGRFADQGVPRTVPFNEGDGHRMAMALGAQLTRGMGRFYGHVVPWPNPIPRNADDYNAVDKDWMRQMLCTVQQFDSVAVFVNLDGKRFADEVTTRISTGDSLAATQFLLQELGHGWCIVDSSDDNAVSGAQTVGELGATVLQADSIEELAGLLEEQGVRKSTFLKTMDEYNNGDPEDFDVPRTGLIDGSAPRLVNGPYYAIAVTGGYSCLFGGLKINTDAQVIGEADQPIANLYATACLAGGFAYDEYVGSLSLSAVYGKAAAENALASLA